MAEKDAIVAVRLDRAELCRLDELAGQLGVTRSQALRRLLKDVHVIPARLVVTEAPTAWVK